MCEIKVIGCEPKRLRESESGFRDKEDKPIPACLGPKIKVREHGMQLELVEVLHFLNAWLLAFDDDFTRWITGYESFVNGIENGAFDLMVKIHGGLALMMLCISVDELLVCGSIHIGESEFRDELAEPGLRKSIFAHGHVSDGAFLVRSHPLGVVVAEQRF